MYTLIVDIMNIRINRKIGDPDVVFDFCIIVQLVGFGRDFEDLVTF